MGKKHIPLAVVAATAIALSSGQSAFATEPSTRAISESGVVHALDAATIASVEEITTNSITVVYSTDITADTIKKANDIVVKQGETKYDLEDESPTINDDKKTVTYKFKKPLSSLTYGVWTVDNISTTINDPRKYPGLKVINIDKKGIKVQLPASVTAGETAQSIEVKNPDGATVTLKTDSKIESDKTVTYLFATELQLFAAGKWIIDTLEYDAHLPKVAEYDGVKVLSITKDGIILTLPKSDTTIAPQLSVKMPNGDEVAVEAPISKDADRNVVYTFKSKPEEIATGTWTINTDTKFTVLSEEANKAKVVAVQKKIKTAKTTLSTNKNYVKNILAAQAAYDALTIEQKKLLPATSSDKSIMSKEDLDTLYKDITGENGVYTLVEKFESTVKSLDPASTEFVSKVEEAKKLYDALTKNQLSYLDAKVKKQYTAYLNEAIVKEAFSSTSDVVKNADKIIAFNKAYKKLSKTEKEDILLDSAKKQKVTELTDKTLQKNASAALAVQKKFDKLEVQKKNDKNKKLYYEVDNTGKKVSPEKETTTKTSEPVMVYSLSAVTKAQTALDALKIKNEAAWNLVDKTLLENASAKGSTVATSIANGQNFNDAVTAIANTNNFVEAFNKAKAAYIALTPDEQKYAIDKNALKQYKAYLKIDKVAVMYAKMTAPEQTTKSMKLAYDPAKTVSSITNDVKFSKGKFTIPKGNYEFAFKDGDEAKVAYYKDGKWTVADTLPELTKTIATAQEIYAYAKAFNALKDADEAILTKGPNGEVYKQYVGKENDYKKAAAVEKKIVSAAKSKRKATIASAQKAYDALTADQQKLVTNETELTKLK